MKEALVLTVTNGRYMGKLADVGCGPVEISPPRAGVVVLAL